MTQPQQPGSQVERNATFAAVAVVAVVAAILAGSADAPNPAPQYALENEIVYSIEAGLAIFVGMYVPAVAIWLALQSSQHLDEAERHLEESRRKLAVARELRRQSVFGG